MRPPPRLPALQGGEGHGGNAVDGKGTVRRQENLSTNTAGVRESGGDHEDFGVGKIEGGAKGH